MTDDSCPRNSSLSSGCPVSTRTGSAALSTKLLIGRIPRTGMGKYDGSTSISGVAGYGSNIVGLSMNVDLL
jgi:hypothetical protein